MAPSSRQSHSPVGRALEERQLYVVFQPILDARTGKIFAYEALARSRSKELPTAPELFEMAVKERLCGRLGRELREMALAGCPDAPLFLNVHPTELADRWLVQPDDPIFAHEPGVFLEVTESVPLSHHALVHSVLNELRGKGVSVVVDDLGAGYSNLLYIADLSPEIVKLDRCLIERLESDPRRQKLVLNIVRLCEDLGARVVAEGIETQGELSAARDAGVDYLQGYLLARPSEIPPPVNPEILPLKRRSKVTRAPIARPSASRIPAKRR